MGLCSFVVVNSVAFINDQLTEDEALRTNLEIHKDAEDSQNYQCNEKTGGLMTNKTRASFPYTDSLGLSSASVWKLQSKTSSLPRFWKTCSRRWFRASGSKGAHSFLLLTYPIHQFKHSHLEIFKSGGQATIIVATKYVPFTWQLNVPTGHTTISFLVLIDLSDPPHFANPLIPFLYQELMSISIWQASFSDLFRMDDHRPCCPCPIS
jgi:hypothetical protein